MPDPITGTVAAVGGGALLGGLAGSQEQGGGTQTQTSEPWGPQQPYLTYGFEQAKNAYQNASANPVFQGQRVAALNPFTSNIANLVGGYAPTSFGFGQNALTQGSQVARTGANFAGNAADLYSRFSGIDPTEQIIANAGQYANSPYAEGMIDAAGRDVTRNLYENQLPTLAKAAAGSGNTNSTRAGVENAIATRGAADRLADISSSIRGQLFNTGLQQSQNQFNQNLTNSLAANQQLSNAYGAGLNGMIQGQQMLGNAFDQGNAAGGVFQNQQQNQLNSAMQTFNEGRDIPLDLLGRYMGLVQGNYGGTTTTQLPSYGGGWQGALTGALGGALGGAGIAQKLGGFNITPTGGMSTGSYGNSVNNLMGTGNNWFSGMWPK